MAVQRLRTTQEKKESVAKQSRREIANLIEKGKLETARIKVENIINEVSVNALTQDRYMQLE
jgi:vacuolar protein sorting-associated protein IST1